MRHGVVVMAYGTPADLGDVARYYTDIRHGRPPPPELLDELVERYRAIGGRSPLLEITQSQAKGIEERLDGVTTYVGQKHAAPFIPDAIERMAADGVERAVGIVMAPHYSALSIGDYARRVTAAADEIDWSGAFEMIESWHLEDGYISFLAREVQVALGRISGPARARTTVLFTAHSLPAAIVDEGDPYPDQLAETAAATAKRAGIDRWGVAWQSAARTPDAWLGPDVRDVLDRLAEEGDAGAVVCPCGFVSDHLEVLYDLDIEARAHADRLGMEFARTSSPNDAPEFLDTLARVVRRALVR